MEKSESILSVDLPYSKLNIIFLNVFCVLQKAATLNLSKLNKDLERIKKVFPHRSSITLYVLQNLIPIFLLTKFVVAFFSLITKIIAMLPILSDEHPEMLLPTIMAQLIENILLPLLELILGFAASKYTVPSDTPLLTIFIISLMIKVFVGVIILNVYMNYFTRIHAAPASYPTYDTILPRLESEETFLNKETLS